MLVEESWTLRKGILKFIIFRLLIFKFLIYKTLWIINTCNWNVSNHYFQHATGVFPDFLALFSENTYVWKKELRFCIQTQYSANIIVLKWDFPQNVSYSLFLLAARIQLRVTIPISYLHYITVSAPHFLLSPSQSFIH